ncbi:potassium/sodium hyperpolarization-activated cyclic nucleotide-gated channel 3-like isoform X2 [Oscarella lobularis]|uniref:potassium/sodium hyperpolarization-activated cyclic nucleotide-gated channel 3-like isoform X2 n=1 Tax=Oscarella lobularis TaxID=121494 RepID=UPI0033138123
MATHSSGVETSKSTRTTGNVLNRFSSFFRNIRRPNQCAPEEKSTNDDEEKGRYNLSRATIGRSMPSLPISRFRSSAQMLGNLEEEDEENEEAENQSPSQTFPPFKIARLNRRGGSHLLDLNVPKKKSTTFITSWFSVADNKMSLKLFGSRRAIESEQERQQRSSPWIIHPCSVFRMYWDILTLIILALNLILLPLVIAFFSDQKLSTHWIVLNSLTDIVFLLDVVVNFRTGFLTDGHSHEIVNLDSKAIAIRYLKTWFVLDAVASLPIDNIVNIFLDDESYSDNVSHLLRASKALKVLRLAKLLSLLRLLRLSRLMRFFDQWEEIFNITKAVFRILKLIGMMLLLAHWSGCLQYMVPYLQGFPEDSWVAINHLQNAPVGTAYTWSLFKSLSHMLCIGYGRFPPMNVSDAWLTIISMMIGASFYALFIGHISSHVLTANSPSRLYQQKLSQVEEYMRCRKLPMHTRNRILNYFSHKYQGKFFNEDEIISELSDSLRTELASYNCNGLVQSVPLFQDADPYFVQLIVTRLRFEVFLPDDVIVQVGTIGHKMYFIREGIVDVIDERGDVCTSLTDGSYFGEICLLRRSRRSATIKAITVCDLYSLSMEHFNDVLDEFPDIRLAMEKVAAERLVKLTKSMREKAMARDRGSVS